MEISRADGCAKARGPSVPELNLGDSVEGATVFAVCALIAIAILISDRVCRRASGSRWRRSAPVYGPWRPAKDTHFAVKDNAAQLRAVMAGSFEKRRVLSYEEYRIFKIVESLINRARAGHRVFAQTSLGEILRSDNSDAFHSINSKRIDILIVDRDGWPALAVEHQGSGHYQGNAAARDAIKKEALRKAGVRYLEVTDSDDDTLIRDRVCEMLGYARPSRKAYSSMPLSGQIQEPRIVRH